MPKEIPQPMAPLGNALAGNENIKLPSTGQDVLAASDLCRTLTNPKLTADMNPADVEETVENLVAAQSSIPLAPSERKAASQSRASTPTAPPVASVSNPTPVTNAPAVRAPMTKVFLTGRLGGADEVARQTGAFLINMKTLVASQMKEAFGLVPTPSIAAEFSAWSQGVVTPQVPMTLTRTLLESLLKQKFPTFGQPDYWISLVESAAATAIARGQRVVVTGVDTVANFKGLAAKGFLHFHVMLSNITAQNRTASPDPLANALDNNVIKQISFQREGQRLRVVWNDNQPSPSGRFYSLADFLSEFQAPVIGEDEVGVL